MQALNDRIAGGEFVLRRGQQSLWTKDGKFVAIGRNGWVDYPLRYPSGNVGYDYPERFTKTFLSAVRAKLHRLSVR